MFSRIFQGSQCKCDILLKIAIKIVVNVIPGIKLTSLECIFFGWGVEGGRDNR